MFVSTLVCLAFAASSVVPALATHAGGYRRADFDDDYMFALERREKDSQPKRRPRPRPMPEGALPHAIMRRGYTSVWARDGHDKHHTSAPKYNTYYRSDLKHPQPIRPNPKWVGPRGVIREDDAGLWEREYDEDLWARMEMDELD